MSDVAFFVPAFKESTVMNRKLGKEGDVWLYSFTHKGFTMHALDLFLLLNMSGLGLDAAHYTEQDMVVARLFGRYLANFIKTGNPNGPATDRVGEVR